MLWQKYINNNKYNKIQGLKCFSMCVSICARKITCNLYKEKKRVVLEYSSCHMRDNSFILVNAEKPQSTTMTNSAITLKAPINSNGGKWR